MFIYKFKNLLSILLLSLNKGVVYHKKKSKTGGD